MTALHLRIALIALLPALLLAPGHVSAADSGEALRLVERLQSRLASCRDYQYRINGYERRGDREEERSFRLYVKDGRLVRIHVIAGRGRGSEAVLNARGQVRARKGGMLKAFARTLSPDDRRVCSLRGVPFWDAVCHNFLRELERRMNRPGAFSQVGTDRERPGTLLLSLQLPAGTRERYWIDPKLMHVVWGEVYEGDILVQRFEIADIRENTGLSDSFFSF
jgi:outer membrane lipoprotein-sorting protein